MPLTLPELLTVLAYLGSTSPAPDEGIDDISEVDAYKLDPYGSDYDYPEPRYEH